MKSLLITGAAGFVGKHLIKKLDKYDVTCFIRKGRKIEAKAKISYGDITRREDVIRASKGKDVIINLASPNTQIYKINYDIIVNGTKNIIEAAKKNEVKRIITLSSCAAYRKNLDNYGRAKREADELLQNSGLDVVILKPTMIYGKGGYAFNKLISSIKKFPFFVFVIGNGKYKIQPIYVEDTISAILAAIELKNKGPIMFDVGGPYPIEYDEFVKIVLKVLNKKKVVIHIPISLALAVTWFLDIFVKNIAWSTTTIRRMTEETSLDIKSLQRELKVNPIGYDEGLKFIQD